jgi:hypothetical protein
MRISTRSLILVTGLVLGGLALADAAQAAPRLKNPGATAGHGGVIQELHAVASLLNKADRDYKGHRAAAVADIHKAIHALGGEHKKHKGPKKPTGGGKEPQDVSDGQLKHAIKQLEGIEKQLGAHKGAAKAKVDIKKAIHNLHTALKIA